MSRVIVLDAGPLGLVTSPARSPEVRAIQRGELGEHRTMNGTDQHELDRVHDSPHDGETVPIAEADDFDREVEMLRSSEAFQRFLDERSRSTRRIPLEEIEAAIEAELEAEG